MRLPGAVELMPTKVVSSARGLAVPFLQPDLEWTIEPAGQVT